MKVSPSIRRTVGTFIRTTVPPKPELDRDLFERVLDQVELSLGDLPSMANIPFSLGFMALEGLAILMSPRPRLFSQLSEEERAIYLDRWAHSSISILRDFFKAIKGFVMLAYYEQPEVMQHLDYDPQSYVDELKANDGNQRD